jgi:hypothetical protein
MRSSASLNSASAPRRELLPSHLALRHHRASMLNFLALPQGRQLVLQARRGLINNLARWLRDFSFNFDPRGRREDQVQPKRFLH